MVETKQEDRWEVVHGNKWTPVIGDSIQGVYVKEIPARKQDESNQYILKADGKEMTVFGTTDLDSKFKEIPVGWEVRITFMEEKQMKPPKHPFKVFEVKKREYIEDKISGAAGDDQETNNSPTLNSYDPGEMAAFIQGVEQELAGKNLPMIELNMLSEAKEQIGDDEAFWELAKKAILDMKYPVKEA